MRDYPDHKLAGLTVSPDTLAALFPRVDSPASAQDLLSRIKQEEHPCVWDQQELADRDIPTDPNSGEQDARGRTGDKQPVSLVLYLLANPSKSLWVKSHWSLRE